MQFWFKYRCLSKIQTDVVIDVSLFQILLEVMNQYIAVSQFLRANAPNK